MVSFPQAVSGSLTEHAVKEGPLSAVAVQAASDEARVRRDFAVFQGLVSIAEEFLAASRLPLAAACAEIAATCAWRNHPGLFASARLERLLIDLGRRTVPKGSKAVSRARRASPRHVLHVMSKARPMGGDSRFACRWIQADSARRHSIAITNQDGPIPEEFIESVSSRGGQVHRLNADTHDPILRAVRLRALLEDVDFVALHLYPDDIVPMLAFAHRDGLPPMVFMNYSDHTFWLGVNISDLVVQLRRCSVPLSLRRRHIEPLRLATLPIPLPPAERTLSRADAKAQLGVPRDSVVLLSVGTGFKYEPVGGPGFLEVLLPVITKHHEAVLLTVGPQPTGDWAAAYENTGGRVVALGRRHDTATLFQAADVYLDSFPFTSPTAALEAGSHGLPLVAYCPRTGDAQVLCPGAPGLDESVCRLNDVPAYSQTVSRLIADPDLRQTLGDLARRSVEHNHTGAQWLERLEDLYRLASGTTPQAIRGRSEHREMDDIEVGELDVVLNGLYRIGCEGLGGIIDRHVGPFPFATRVAILRRMLNLNRSFSFDLFFPGRFVTRIPWRPPGWKQARRFLARPVVEPHDEGRCASM
jgi:glycosyltransferase involved in cell wall biosynthesis